MDCLDDFEVYDYLLDQPLLAHGWKTHLVSWRNEQVDWNDFDVVLIRSPWDYQDAPEQFLRILETIDASSATLENSLATVQWNINKKYLRELESKGVTIVPTIWKEQFDASEVATYFSHFNTEQLVIKPCVSANADNTFWLTKHNVDEYLSQLERIFAQRDHMVQPFMEHIVSEGEFSCFFFDGNYSHSILKTPKKDDFRVQEEHGGQLKLITPEPKLMEQALFSIQQLAQMPMYARVDFVRFNDEFAMMEAELIEPSLYFNMDDQSAQRFADAFAAKWN